MSYWFVFPITFVYYIVLLVVFGIFLSSSFIHKIMPYKKKEAGSNRGRPIGAKITNKVGD